MKTKANHHVLIMKMTVIMTMMMMMLQRTGLLKMLDVECSVRGCPETYVQKVKVQHKDNSRYKQIYLENLNKNTVNTLFFGRSLS
jgi:hypothetical protein